MKCSWSCLLQLTGLFGISVGLVAECPKIGVQETPYCVCESTKLIINCDFKREQEVVLTKDLLAPYDSMKKSTAYIKIQNAKGVNVTSDFVQKWLEVSSAAFDVWHSGILTLKASSELMANDTSKRSKTYAGIGIIDCHVPEVPVGFLRDRAKGAFRIKDSKVGIIRAGFIDNVTEMRYMVLEDSEVDEVEGSVTAEGYITMSQHDVHSWNGLVLSNVTINKVGHGAFNVTHKSDIEEMLVKNSRIGQVASGAFEATGDVAVIITDNIFQSLERQGFRVDVTGQVTFNGNQMGVSGVDALEALRCHNSSSIQNNTFLVSYPHRLALNQSGTLFQPSCGKPQLFMVLSPLKQLSLVEDTRAAWVLGTLLALLILALVCGIAWTHRMRHPILSKMRFPILHKGQSQTSLENLPRNIELNIPREDLEEAAHVKDMILKFESKEIGEPPQFDVNDEEEGEAVIND